MTDRYGPRAVRWSFFDLVDPGLLEHHIARFWSTVDRVGRSADGCWDFLGGLSKKGYGRFKIGGKLLLAHRVAYEISNGPLRQVFIPRRRRPEVMHECDRPSCCNPAHLVLGMHSKNVQDMYDRGRR